MKGIVSQHIMQKGTNMDDMEKLLTIKDVSKLIFNEIVDSENGH